MSNPATKPFPALEAVENAPEEFDSLLTAAQPRLRGYVASLLGAWSDVDDLVQETNLVLLAKRESFEPGSNFIAWAFRVAYFKATTWRRDRQREGHVSLSESAFQELAAHAAEHFETRPSVDVALAECLRKLPAKQRQVVHAKYVEKISLVKLAETLGCGANALHQIVSRTRLALRKCIAEHITPELP